MEEEPDSEGEEIDSAVTKDETEKIQEPIYDVNVGNYIEYIQQKKDVLICSFNKREMQKNKLNYRLRAIDCPIPRKLLSTFGEEEFIEMGRIFGKKYDKAFNDLTSLIQNDETAFENLKLSRFAKTRFIRFFVHPTFFWAYVEENTSIKEDIHKFNCKNGYYHYELLKYVSILLFKIYFCS